jgi:DedD protein
MAKAASDEQLQLRRRARRRLVGAIALVTVIAVVLPWILEREPRPAEEPIAVQIPSQDPPFEHRVPASPEPAREPASQPASPPATAEAEGAHNEQQSVAAPEKAPVKDRAAPAEAKKKTAEDADRKQQFVVQVAALADADKATAIQRELAAKGLKVYTEKVKSGSGTVTRVRVGPFASRDLAEKERARLKALGFEGNVSPR